jgi:hypothetical protein
VTVIPTPSVLDDLGIKMEDFSTVSVTTETGAACTGAEAKRVLQAIDGCVGFRYNRASFIVNFIDWGFRNGFTEELKEAGGFVIESDPTIQHQQVFKTVEEMHRYINDQFANAHTGREFTFRRFGRFLGPKIPEIILKNPDLSKFYSTGTPMSNRLGVPASDFMAVCSIFEYIKPYQKWSRSEKEAWTAHNKSAVRVSNTQDSGFIPADLRINPSRAATLVETGRSDFDLRHSAGRDMSSDYGRGADIFKAMQAGQTDRTGLGYQQAI